MVLHERPQRRRPVDPPIERMLQQRRPQRHQAQLKFLKRIGGSH
jgi:hypothetical protein